MLMQALLHFCHDHGSDKATYPKILVIAHLLSQTLEGEQWRPVVLCFGQSFPEAPSFPCCTILNQPSFSLKVVAFLLVC